MGDRLRALRSRFEVVDPVDLGARMILILLLFSTWVTTDFWYFKFPLRALAVIGLILPPLHRDPRLWTAVSLLLFARALRFWFIQDNHVFLLTWFSVGVALSLRSPDPLRALRENARVLVGLSFLFAVAWKFLSGEFLNGGYFSYAFLADGRFEGTARLFGGVPEDTLLDNAVASVKLARGATESAVLGGMTPRVLWTARLAAWWTLAIESILAVLFLAPIERLRRGRHAALLVFGATTYLIIDIGTFGWTLMAMGAAQTEPEKSGTRAAYLAVALLVLAYTYIPILAGFARLTGP